MANIYLKDGRIIDVPQYVMEKVGLMILMKPWNTRITVLGESFKLNELVTEPEEQAKIAQVQMYTGIYPQAVKQKYKKTGELS